MRELIINSPVLIITLYFILSLVIYFILEYKKKPLDDDFGGNVLIALFWPALLPLAVFVIPFLLVSKLAKNLRETKQKKNQINVTSLTCKKYNGW